MRNFIYLFLVPVLWSCGAAEKSATETNSLEGAFEVASIAGQESLAPNLVIRFAPQDSKVSGFAGCNNFFGSYTLQEKKLHFSKMGMTRKMCMDSDLKERSDQAMMNALEAVRSYKYESGKLILLDERAKVLITAQAFEEKGVSDLVVHYEVKSMGASRLITVNGKELTCKSVYPEGEATTMELSQKAQEQWVEMTSPINWTEIPSYEAPSSQRHTDGAAYAKLSVIVEGRSSYSSQDFDHGNPPEQLKEIMDFILKEGACN